MCWKGTKEQLGLNLRWLYRFEPFRPDAHVCSDDARIPLFFFHLIKG